MLNSRKLFSLFLFISIQSLHTASGSETTIPTQSNPQQLELLLPSTDSKKQKARKRKTKNKSEKKKKISTYRDMTYEELLAAKNVLLAQSNFETAIKYLEQMLKLCNDITTLGEIIIEIADLLSKNNEYGRAAQKYAEYAALYPGGEKIEYALFKAIENSFECTLVFDRDQTKTEETLALAEAFLKKDHFKTYPSQVTLVRDKCYIKLAESEVNICSFYLKRGRLKPAEKRINTIRETWLPKLPDVEASLIILEADLLAQKEALEQTRQKALLMAENKTTKQKHMAERF